MRTHVEGSTPHRRLSRRLSLCSVVIAIFLLVSPVYAVRYHLTPLGFLPGDNGSYAYGINSSGQVVGKSTSASGERAFIWSPSTGMVHLGALSGATSSTAYAINDSGKVVGSSGRRPFLWQPGSGMMGLPGLAEPPYNSGTAYAINNSDEIVGHSLESNSYEGYVDVAARWKEGVVSALWYGSGCIDAGAWAAAINNNGMAVGISGGPIPEAYYWTAASGARPVPGGFYSSSAYAVNDLGQVVGWSDRTPFYGPFLWSATTGVTQISAKGILDINNRCQIVGTDWDHQATLWDPVTGNQYLKDLLDASGQGWRPYSATCINDRGDIAGYGYDPQYHMQAFLLTEVVPEPTGLLIMASGVLGMAVRFRRR